MNSKVATAVELMKANLGKTLLLSELASVAHLSVSHFSYLFRKELGTSPGRYLMRLRMEKAVELLSERSLSVKEVMAKVGFNDKSDFARSFRKAYGIAPSDYRRNKL
jgi:AraC family transcriptional regulator of arabinose operon